MNIISRMFCFPAMERELRDRVADRDAVITEKDARIQELEDRLFIRFGLPPKGVDLSGSQSGVRITPYRTGRQRVHDMVTPPIVTLSAEDEKAIEESLTQ